MAESSGPPPSSSRTSSRPLRCSTRRRPLWTMSSSDEIKEKMNFVRQFCFSHGLLGEAFDSVDVVGISYPDGTVQGDCKDNVKMRFDSDSYMEMAAKGELK